MSADNGYILRRNSQGQYVLQMYMASADELPDIDDERAVTYQTLEMAVLAYEQMSRQPGFVCEYGLSIDLEPQTLQSKIDQFGTDARRWAQHFIRNVPVLRLEEVERWFDAAIQAGVKTGKKELL